MKYAFIKRHRDRHGIERLCSALEVSRSGYYTWLTRQPSRRAQENALFVEQIKQIHHRVRGVYGSPRMHIELVENGYCLSRGRVERLMRNHGIYAKQSKRHKQTYRHRAVQGVAVNHLNREFIAWSPNEKWASDITFIETREGWLYLAIVLDLYSRAIVGWSMSSKNDGQLVRNAVCMAIEQRNISQPVLVHSDQGCQYTAAAYQDLLKQHNLICSMSRKGDCYDNAVAESFFNTLKNELVYDERYHTRAEAKQSIFSYIELFYNRKRRHSHIGYKAPLEYENMMAVA